MNVNHNRSVNRLNHAMVEFTFSFGAKQFSMLHD